MWFKHILKQQDLPESMESLIRCLWIWTALFILISSFIGFTATELVIFQQYTKINLISHVGFATDTGYFTLFLYSAGISQQLFLSQHSSYKQKICGVMVHHSRSLHSVRQLYNLALAQPLVVWPHWSYTSNLEPTPKLHPLAPTPCQYIFKLAYGLVLSCDKLTSHLSIRGKINQYVVFFMRSLSLGQLVNIWAALDSCTLKNMDLTSFQKCTAPNAEILPAQIAFHSSAAETEFENSCKQKETWHLTGKNNFPS